MSISTIEIGQSTRALIGRTIIGNSLFKGPMEGMQIRLAVCRSLSVSFVGDAINSMKVVAKNKSRILSRRQKKIPDRAQLTLGKLFPTVSFLH